MEKKSEKKLYNIGLDIGTNTVGYAVTDLNGNLIKVKGRNFWGVRLFDEGQTAAARRKFRSSRRRLNRRKLRIKILQSFLEEEIIKVDPDFFKKLKLSYKHLSERSYKYNIFNEVELNDQSFYKKYPTIYHLRYDLIKSNTKFDIRLVYLAIHNTMKYRGNYLYEGQNLESNLVNIKDEIKRYLELIETNLNESINCNDEDIDNYINIVTSTTVNKVDKLKAVVCKSNDKIVNASLKEFTKAILGNKFDFFKLTMADTEDSLLFSYSNDYVEEELLAKISGLEEYYYILFRIYNSIILSNITNNSRYISESMIKRYEKHNRDLKVLKRLIKRKLPDKYNLVFKDAEDVANYTNYISKPGEYNYESFYKFLKKLFEDSKIDLTNDEDYNYIKKSIENENFLRIINIKDNSAIPYQLHLIELKEILNNQKKYYQCIEENEEKIIQTFKFRIPYYVGPLSIKSPFGWVEKKNNERILPWNFEDVVDIEMSAEKFIKRMTNKCTYLIKEEVLPKNSLLIQEYELYNELNKIRINDQLIEPTLKEKIVEKLFKKQKTVTLKALEKFLKTELLFDSIKITGTQKKDQFASSLSTLIDFKDRCKIVDEVNESNIDMIENLVSWITIFSDKKILKNKIKKTYPQLTEEQIESISKLNYSGWSRLSKRLLSEITTKLPNGERKTIVDILKSTNLNFMQIINDKKYEFAKKIELENEKPFEDKITLDDINEFIISPSLRKAVWQAIKLVEEIIHIMKSTPQNIYIEVTRKEGEKVRTESRADKLLKLYDAISKDNEEYYEKSIHEELKNLKKKSNKIDNDRLFLYFTQNGRCLYSGKSLSIDSLHLYEVDHIIPKSLKPDDSFDNLALVIKGENQRKGDSLVLDESIRIKNEKYWRFLNEKGLISDTKLYNLLRKEFSEKDIDGFVNRQLVETNQINKNVAFILSEYYKYKNVDVRLVRASVISYIRKDLGLYKIRNLNDYHHAHDAYLSIVLGEFSRRFIGDNAYGEFKKEFKKEKNEKYGDSLGWVSRKFKQNIFNYEGEVLWCGEQEISKIKHVLNYKDYFITRKAEEQSGEFYKQNPVHKSETNKLMPIKNDRDPKLYGGYTNVNEAYTLLLKTIDNKNKVKYKFISIKRLENQMIKNNPDKLDEIILSKIKGIKYTIIREIKKYQYALVDGHPVYIASNEELNNAQQLHLNWNYVELLHNIEQNKLENNPANNERLVDFLKILIEKMHNEYPLFKNIATKISNSMDKFISMSFEMKCSFILEVIKVMSRGSSSDNFKPFGIEGLTERVSRIRKSFNVENTVFIDQSITGVFEKRVKYGL